MANSTENLYLTVTMQLLLTVFLVTVLWTLYTRLQRFEFFRWWAWAWTASAAYLAAATASLQLGPTWTPGKALLVFTLILAGFLQPVLLVLGGLSWRTAAKPSRRLFWFATTIAVAAALICFFLGFAWRAVPAVGFALRNIPRTLILAAALFYCCAVFWQQFRKNRSLAAVITGVFCFSYALDQSFYFLSFTEMLGSRWHLQFPAFLHNLTNTGALAHSRLLLLDIVDTCGICLGMILLLVERFRHTASALEASEQTRLDLAVDNVSLQLEIRNRQRAEEELRRSEEFSRQVILNSPSAMVVSSGPLETVKLVNEKFTSLFGYTLDEIRTVSDWWPLAYPDPEYRRSTQLEWRDLIEQARQGATHPLSMEARVRCKDGSFRDIEFHLSLVNDLYVITFVDLTERKKSIEDLQESESRYRDLVENSEDLLGTHDLEGRILSINQAPCRRLGYTVEELLRKRMQDLLAPRIRHLFPEFVKRVLEAGHEKGIMVVVTRTGEERIWEYVSTLKKDGVTAPVIRGMAHDITEQFRAEQALRQSEAKFATAFRASPHAMTISSLRDGRFIDVNASFECQSGYSRQEVLGKTIPEIGLWPDSADFAGIMADTLARKPVVGRQVRLRTKSGQMIQAVYSVEIIEINGEPCALAAGEDITERLQMERALRESEAKFRLVADTVSAAIWILQDHRLVYVNKFVESLTGYSREELQAMGPQALVHPDFRDVLQRRSESLSRTGRLLSSFQYKIITKSGEERWLELTDCVTSYEGRPAILASAFDITAAKRAEQDIKQHAMYMDALISNTPLGIVIKDENQLVRFCNPAFERMFLFKESEIQGTNLDDLIAAHDREEAELLSRAVRQEGVVHTTARRRRKDGTFIDVELYGVRVFSGDSFVGAFAIYQDITERKKSEEKLIALRNRLTRAQEEERARIARDLHDDAGQRLALLSIDLEQLKQSSMKLRSSLTQQLESLVKAASEIASDVHNVSRRLHPSQVELLGLPSALSNFCRDFAARNSMEIELENGHLQNKPAQDAALCLFRVAQEAIRNVQKHSGTGRALVQLDEISGSLRLRVSDQGSGFDPQSAELSHGLGLLSMQERLHSLGGELFIHSRLGGGTCIEACIPLSPAVPA
jgi:PAS domain S-box-containing protein